MAFDQRRGASLDASVADYQFTMVRDCLFFLYQELGNQVFARVKALIKAGTLLCGDLLDDGGFGY